MIHIAKGTFKVIHCGDVIIILYQINILKQRCDECLFKCNNSWASIRKDFSFCW